jgi:hypothetical protein
VPEVRTIPAKYIFLDIVGYTRNRSVEAQSDIVKELNDIARNAVESQGFNSDKVIYIPTGDGMCIALLNVTDPFDAHMQIALSILSAVNKHNAQAPDKMRQFAVRIGINENVDNLIEDVNGRRNLAGAGISTAQRIMDKADGGQILVSQSVFDSLNPREKYMSKFKPFDGVTKQGQKLRVHQYVQENIEGLNTKSPSTFMTPVERKLSKVAAYYFAHALKNREFLRSNDRDQYARVVLLWFLAWDSVGKLEQTDIAPYKPMLPLFPEDTEILPIPTKAFGFFSLANQLLLLEKIPFWINCKFAELIQESSDLGSWTFKYFENPYNGPLFVNAEGKEKLKREWPDIWKEFELG